MLSKQKLLHKKFGKILTLNQEISDLGIRKRDYESDQTFDTADTFQSIQSPIYDKCVLNT